MHGKTAGMGLALVVAVVGLSGRVRAEPDAAVAPPDEAAVVKETLAEAAARDPDGAFIGLWRVVDIENRPYLLELTADHRVESTSLSGKLLGPERQGTWRVENGRALITYGDGQTDLLIPRGKLATRVRFAAGQSLAERPRSVSPAFKLQAPRRAPHAGTDTAHSSAPPSFVVADKSY